MKKIILILLLAVTCTVSFANNEMKTLANINDFKSKLKSETSKVNTIQSDFEQVKHLAVFDEDMISNGKFYYQKSDKLSLDYLYPVKYVMTMNGSKIKIASDGKVNVYDMGVNKAMGEMRDMLAACMTGNLDLMSNNYKIEYLHNDKEYLIKVFPLNEEAKKIMSRVDIFLDKKDLSVVRLRMFEAVSDKEEVNYTEYRFTNKKININIPESQFVLK